MNPQDPKQLSPEDIKAIGEIQVGPSKHEVFLNNHYKKLILALVLAAVGGAAIIGYYSYTEQQEESAANELMTALQVKSIAEGPQAAAYKKEAIELIKSNYADTPAAQSALLLEALSLLEKNQADVALTALEQLSQSAGDITLRSRAAVAIANYYTKESSPKATDAWKKLITMEENLYKGFALLNLGDLSSVAGDKQAARQYYMQAQQSAQTSSFVQMKDIELRLKLLDVDAPKPLAPAPVEPTPTIPVIDKINHNTGTEYLLPDATLPSGGDHLPSSL